MTTAGRLQILDTTESKVAQYFHVNGLGIVVASLYFLSNLSIIFARYL